jgi:uncharacterized protein
MIRRIAAFIAACALATLSTGCRTPDSHLYTLSSSVPAAATPGEGSSNLIVFVGPVSIPAIVDLPQIVVRTSANEVTVDEFNRWAAPLASNISHVVAENLAVMLGTPRVSSYQQSLSTDADYRVVIDVQTFDSAPGDAATLSAMWVVRRIKDGKSETGHTTVHEASPQKGYDALASAHSRALGQMSREIADAIRRLEHVPESP